MKKYLIYLNYQVFKVTSIFIIISIIILACKQSNNEIIEIDFDKTEGNQPIIKQESSKTLNVAIAAMISPKKTYMMYESLFTYISEKLDMKVVFKQISTYNDVNKLLLEEHIDMALICTGPYLDISEHVNLLVVPVVNGEPYYQGYIITNNSSGISKFIDLKGKSFIYTDPLSNTGRNFPELLLREYSMSSESFFSSTSYSYSHDISIEMVSRNLVDGASVDALIFDYLAKNEPEKVKNIKIIEISEKYGIPPVVVPKYLDTNLQNSLQEVFIKMHLYAKGKEILDFLNIDKFIIVGDTLYNSTRKSMIIF